MLSSTGSIYYRDVVFREERYYSRNSFTLMRHIPAKLAEFTLTPSEAPAISSDCGGVIPSTGYFGDLHTQQAVNELRSSLVL